MGKKVFVNGPGLYWYDGMTFRKLKKPVKCNYKGGDFVYPKIPLFCLTQKKRFKLIDAIDDFAVDFAKYHYFRGRDEVIDEILDDVE